MMQYLHSNWVSMSVVVILALLSGVCSLQGTHYAKFSSSGLRSRQPQSLQQIKQFELRMADATDIEAKENADPEYQAFLAGASGKPWKGTRIALARRGQVPLPEYSAQDVVRICLAALQNNDDPQLDHGSCVALEFKSPTGALAEGGLDPAAYGRFIRDTDYASLIDFKASELVGELQPLSDSLSVRQLVKISDWQSSPNSKGVTNFDFYLTQVSGNWLLDIILLRK